MHIEVPVLHGERGSLAKHENEEPSEAVRFIIQEAERESDNPLYVLCIGATTNVAKALIIRPQIAQKMTIVTIGGNPHGCGNPGRGFNFGNDVKAANTILHCGGETWQIPNNVYGTIHIGFAEIHRQSGLRLSRIAAAPSGMLRHGSTRTRLTHTPKKARR